MGQPFLNKFSASLSPRTLSKSHFRLTIIAIVVLIFIFFVAGSGRSASEYNKYRYLGRNRLSGLRIAFLNRHDGTHSDFKYVSEQLGFNFAELNPELFTGYGQQAPKSAEINKFLLGDFLCQTFDYVVVADTVPDGRFLLHRLEEEKECGLQKIIFITTNRFDLYVWDPDAYYDLVRRTKERFKDRVVWVSNNVYDIKHTLDTLKFDVEQTLIRPFGISKLPVAPALPASERKDAVLIDQTQTVAFSEILEKHNVPFRKIPYYYGGPTALTQYKAYISIPYQVSTMKTYENLAHGVATLVPTPRYLKQLVKEMSDKIDFQMIRPVIELGDGWEKYIDFYSDEMKDFYFQFDGPEDLKRIIEQGIPGRENVANNTKKWAEMCKENLPLWEKVLSPP